MIFHIIYGYWIIFGTLRKLGNKSVLSFNVSESSLLNSPNNNFDVFFLIAN